MASAVARWPAAPACPPAARWRPSWAWRATVCCMPTSSSPPRASSWPPGAAVWWRRWPGGWWRAPRSCRLCLKDALACRGARRTCHCCPDRRRRLRLPLACLRWATSPRCAGGACWTKPGHRSRPRSSTMPTQRASLRCARPSQATCAWHAARWWTPRRSSSPTAHKAAWTCAPAPLPMRATSCGWRTRATRARWRPSAPRSSRPWASWWTPTAWPPRRATGCASGPG